MSQPRPENPFVHPRLEARDIAFSQPLQWLALAWRDLERCPLVGGVHGLILAVAGGLFSWLYHDHYWWIVALIASCMMIAPLLAVGMYQVSRMLERGEEPTLADAMRVWLCGDLRLVQFGALLALCSLGWLITLLVANAQGEPGFRQSLGICDGFGFQQPHPGFGGLRPKPLLLVALGKHHARLGPDISGCPAPHLVQHAARLLRLLHRQIEFPG